jgi:hypothetical protein
VDQRYSLEIYRPTEGVAAVFESDQPFGTIQRGDLVNVLFTGAEARQDVLRVVDVEHILWRVGTVIKHKICVFTEAEANSRERRRAG